MKRLILTCLKHCLPTYLAATLSMLALAFGTGNSELMAQALPTNMTINSASLFKTGVTDIDSATIGATLPYFIYPDVNFNPAFDDADPLNATKLASTFTWPSAAGYTVSTVTGYAGIYNYRNITWNTLGSYAMTVNETSNATYGGCTGSTTFNVAVINKPTAGFTNAAVLLCPGSTAVNLPLTVTTDVNNVEKQLQFNITCDKAGTNVVLTLDATNYAKGTGSIVPQATVAALSEGIYTFTLNKVNDRISRKCSLNGTVVANTTYKVYVTSPKPTLKTSAVR